MAILALLLVSGGIVVVGCLDEKRKRPRPNALRRQMR